MLIDNIICLIGGTGSLGEELITRLGSDNKIHVISRDELKQWSARTRFPQVNYHIGDIRNRDRITVLLHRIQPDIIINCAALKHIDACENNVCESIATNVQGVENLIAACVGLISLSTFVHISTDKSVVPTTLYGACKMLGERLVIDAARHSTQVKYVCVRYGNVLNSRGSIIPRYMQISQDVNSVSFPVTDPNMTRFFMTLTQSCDLILNSILYGVSGEIWIPDVLAFKIQDLANWFSAKYAKPISRMDIRSGEKMHEILVNEVELSRTEVLVDIFNLQRYYVIHSHLNPVPCKFPPRGLLGSIKCVLDRVLSSEFTHSFEILESTMTKLTH